MKCAAQTLLAILSLYGTSAQARLAPNACIYPPKSYNEDYNGKKNYNQAGILNAGREQLACEKKKGVFYSYTLPSANGGPDTIKTICKSIINEQLAEQIGPYLMNIPDVVQKSHRQVTVWDYSGQGLYAFTEKPITVANSDEKGRAEFYKKACNEKTSINFGVSGCKTLSFADPSEYSDKKNPVAFFVGHPSTYCDKLSKNVDVENAKAALVRSNPFGALEPDKNHGPVYHQDFPRQAD